MTAAVALATSSRANCKMARATIRLAISASIPNRASNRSPANARAIAWPVSVSRHIDSGTAARPISAATAIRPRTPRLMPNSRQSKYTEASPLSVHVPLVGLTDPAARRFLTLSASAEPASSDDAVAFFAARTLRRLHPLGHMRTQEPPARVRPGRASAGGRKAALLLGAAIGSVGLLVLGVVVGGPLVLAKRGDLPLERVYGDL